MSRYLTTGCFAAMLAAFFVLPLGVSRGEDSKESAAPVAPAEHPLAKPLEMAKEIQAHIDADIKDYTAVMHKRERINGDLHDPESMYLKVRHEPFSAYMYFQAPKSLKGQEAIYVAGANDNKLIAHGVGLRGLITVHLDPNGSLAMEGQRYPITEVGFKNLIKRLIEVAEKDMKYGECDVKIYENAKVAGRPCKSIIVTHPNPRKNFLFNVAKVYIDKELNVPVRYEAYDWPSTEGGKPELIEEYTYTDIKLNQGLTDADFDPKNKDYHYP